jgi:Flp pilus assembly protein TadG
MISHFKNRFWKCSAGAVAVLTAIVLPVLLGFVSLGTEVGHWYLAQREMQGAADAAAISAAAEYISQNVAGNPTSTSYQTVGVNYASLNGFTIPSSNVCLQTVSGLSLGCTAQSVDTRPIICSGPPCIVAEITQNTMSWLTTKLALEPVGRSLRVQSIPGPTLGARAVVSVKLAVVNTPPTGNSCILTLANERNAIQVRGGGDIHANCGLLIDGGRDQNARTPTINSAPLCSDGTTPPCGGLTLSGSNAMVHITNLTAAASTAGPAGSTCPDPNRCFLYSPSTTVLPTSAIFTNVSTPDPFATRIFTKPSRVVVTGVALSSGGSAYTKGTRTFTVSGGSFTAPAKFTATVSNSGVVTGTPVLIDPGAYSTLPSNPVSVAADDGKGSKATFTLTTGNCLPGATVSTMINNSWIPVPGRAYCSIPATKTVNFPTGIYYIEGGDATCVGLCVTSGNTNVTSDAAGVTFVLTNTNNGTSYAQFTVSGNNTVNLTAPATNINADGSPCSTACANTTRGMIIFQDRNAPITTALSSGGAVTSSQPSAGSTLNSLSGCGNNPTCRTLSGSLYFPNQTLNFSGNGQVQGICFGLVSKYLDDAGTPIFQNGCLPGTTGGGGGTGSVTGGTFKLAQ